VQAEVKKSNQEPCILDILIDDLKDVDFAPLFEICTNLDTSEIEAVDIRNESPCVLSQEYALPLMRAIKQKLRVVELHDVSITNDFVRYIMVLAMDYLCKNEVFFYCLITVIVYSHLSFNLRR
jgi:hypothetical protein